MRTLKYYLWKLKYLEGVKISKKDLDKKNIPNNIYYNQWSGNYIKIDCTNLNTNDIDIFLKVKKAYDFNIIKTCIVICTICFVLATIHYIDSF